MLLGTMIKGPTETLDYDIKFERWLTPGDTITDAVVSAENGIEVGSVQIFGDIVKIWMSGGTLYRTYSINCLTTTSNGRVVNVCFNIRITGC